MTPKQSWAGLAHAISPDARYGHPALRPLGGNLASAILASLGFLRRSIGMGNPSSITDQIPLRVL